MYEYIRGILAYKGNETAVVEAGGIGYEISVPDSTLYELPSIGDEVKLFLHFYVREDMQKLYGFLTEEERSVFRSLIGVNKIGPKVAINILSGLSVKEIAESVQLGDITKIKGIPGIGEKTAARLVMELKNKLNISVNIDRKKIGSNISLKKVSVEKSIEDDVYSALLALGYSDSQIVNAINRVKEVVEEDIALEDWIKKALQVI